jgi:glycosyltransferase involved in cell wall biosynthesis
MKLSVIVSVLNSHEIVRRQLAHFERMGVPDNVEIIYLDDGSDPPLSIIETSLKNYRVVRTPNPKPEGNIFVDGRVSIARNMGARLAQGEFLLMTDIDYIIREADIEAGCNMKYDKQSFRRQFGVLLEDGTVTQDMDTLRRYGLLESRIRERGTLMSPHPNNFIMRKSTFLDIGGYRENLQGIYPSKGDTWFKRDWTEYYWKGKATLSPDRTTLLMFPNGQFCGDVDYNPFGLFHAQSRKTEKNHWYIKDRDASVPH